MDRSHAVVAGSIQQVAAQANQALAEAFLNAELACLVDTSGSMDTCDSRGGRARYSVAVEELTKLQCAHPGKVVVISFASSAGFCPGGVPTREYGGGTDVAGALEFARILDGTVRYCLISDGCPNDAAAALRVARTFTSEISTIFVGAEDDAVAREFLRQLATQRGGTFSTAKAADLVSNRVESLLLGTG